ncbi:diguanylate cyclase domain-containing protein [Rheinheimera maricola]|uniref:Diguanylate cyclase n=1 Tax=Rheinheimera maricola TaxID=2793282 RepID=A0ABS7XDX1_9GAMM|nr:diguanylate cyclase [Rheinheimera maricola]MBZ9613340.1 diguanylate cyclase [Rheinheimera maricola]
MQSKPGFISHIHSLLPQELKILRQPRRSYAELQRALQRAETITERTLCELLALRQSQQLGNEADTPDSQQLQHQLRFMLKQAKRCNKGFALLFVQLDQYKHICDNYGARLAQQVSELVLARLMAVVRDCDSVCRQTNDKFLLLISDVTRVYDAVLVAEKVIQKLAVLNGLVQEPLGLSVSIGISRYPQDGNDATILIELAAAAMAHAQNRGGNQFSLLR